PAIRRWMICAAEGGVAGSEYTEVPGVSHMLHLEEPDAFHNAVRPFLDRQAARTSNNDASTAQSQQ
ncbi:MAG: alpha/beta hydrolase, partial [Pseudomonadota bacterium]